MRLDSPRKGTLCFNTLDVLPPAPNHMTLVEAALRDQERRILAASPKDVRDRLRHGPRAWKPRPKYKTSYGPLLFRKVKNSNP